MSHHHIDKTETSPLLKKSNSDSMLSPPASSCITLSPRCWDIILLLTYFTLGVTFYTSEEVGFGDFAPTTVACKLFTCTFVFVGLAIIASLLSNLLDYIVEERAKVKLEKLHNLFDEQKNALKSIKLVTDPSSECFTLCNIVTIPPVALPVLRGLQQSVLIISMNLLIGSVFYAYVVDNYSVIDAFYLSSMIITTVGYGDIKPTNDISRLFTVFYALFGTLATAKALSKFASAISDYKQAQLEFIILNKPLNLASLLEMDVDKSNNGVSKEEFVLYKLKALGALDADLVLRAEAQFRQLDITRTGYLSVEDIVCSEEKILRAEIQKLST